MRWDAEFAAFVRESADDLFRASYVLCGNRERAADLVQETLTRLYPKWDRVQAADIPIAYVRRCLVNRFVSDERRHSGHESLIGTLPDRAYVDEDSEVDRLMLAGPLAALETRQRAAVTLRYLYEFSDRDAARAMRCTQAAYRGLLRRAVAHLHGDLFVDATGSEGRA